MCVCCVLLVRFDVNSFCTYILRTTHSNRNILLNGWSIDRVNRLSVLSSYVVHAALLLLLLFIHSLGCLTPQLKATKLRLVAIRFSILHVFHILFSFNDMILFFFPSPLLLFCSFCSSVDVDLVRFSSIKMVSHHFYHLQFEW